MVIAPIIFCIVVSRISHIQDARKVCRVGVKALVYFEIVSTFALLTNITGNGIATVFVSWWEGELDHDRLLAKLDRTIDSSDVETAVSTG